MFLALSLAGVSLPGPQAASQDMLAIAHRGMTCIPEEDFAVVAAELPATSQLRSVKLYFRSVLYADFYYVEMSPHAEFYVGILPQPSEETREVVYYIEAVDSAFEIARSPEFVVPVREPCSQRRSAVAYLGEEGGIVVGSTTSGASPVPPGFKAIGVIGTITAAGITSTAGGGIGAGSLVVAGAAAGGAAGAVVVATSENEEEPSTTTSSTSVTGGAPTTAPPGTTSAPGTTTAPSTTTSPGTTTTAPTTTSTPTSSTPPAPVACFNVTNTSVSLCRLELDASCSTGPIDTYEWVLDAGGALNGPVSETGQVVSHQYALFPLCTNTEVTNVLTVRGPGGTNTVSKSFRFLLQRTQTTTFDSRIAVSLTGEVEDPATRISVTLGSTTRTISGPSETTLLFAGRAGVNVFEARADSAFEGAASLTLDFAATDGFVPGSIVVERGEALALTGTMVVFRLAPIRFRFQLASE